VFTVWHPYCDAGGRQLFKEGLRRLDTEIRAELLTLIRRHKELAAQFDDTSEPDCPLDDLPLDDELRVLRARVKSRRCGVIYASLPERDEKLKEFVGLVVYVSRRRDVPVLARYLAKRRLRFWIDP